MDNIERKISFAEMGKGFQEKIVQALIQDHAYCDQISDILQPKYFSYEYLEEITKNLFDYKVKYKEFPSLDLLSIMVSQDKDLSDVLQTQVRDFLTRAKSNPLNGDLAYVRETSLEFCKKQALVGAVSEILDRVDDTDYGSIQKIMKEALNKGAPRDAGHEYSEGLEVRARRSVRQPISTGWPVIDKALNGGWERATLTTFIAPTGAGKSMFLVNVAAAAIEQGFNVLYCTLEMADWKIGLRADSYFSGVAINDIPDHEDKVRHAVKSKAKGRLIIKEWPTKQATVQTIRAHIQKLEQTKEFKPDFVVVDYADLLRGSRNYGEKRHELEGIYEELRGLAQEFGIVMVTADQTNRAGLNDDIVTLSSIAESYGKATVCDLIITISRKMEDKQNGTGRLFIAKSRLGDDGVVYNFLLKPATVKVRVLDQTENPLEILMGNPNEFQKTMADRYARMANSGSVKKTGSDGDIS